jgi:hypothetical protein
MKLIRVTYRATFQQPLQGPLNPMGATIRVPVAVEVYPVPGPKWWVRTPTNGRAQNPPWPLVAVSTAEQMRQDVAAQFEKQLTPWEIWGNPGTNMDSDRLLQPDEIEVRENGQVYFKDPPKAATNG